MADLLRYLYWLTCITSPLVFVLSFTAYIYFNRKMKKLYDHDLDEYYHELEDQHPAIQKYEKYCRIALTLAVLAALIMCIAIFI